MEKTIVTEAESLWHGYSVPGDFRGQRKSEDGWSSVKEQEGDRGERTTIFGTTDMGVRCHPQRNKKGGKRLTDLTWGEWKRLMG